MISSGWHRRGTANNALKALTTNGSMLAGCDSRDDTALQRAGVAGELFNARSHEPMSKWA